MNKEAKEAMGELYVDSNEAALDIDLMNDVMIQTIPYPMGFRTVMESMDSDLFVIPSFQRVYRWTELQAQELAISLVRGMPIPTIYGYRNERQQIVILDGQQRLISLYLYYKGKFIKKKRNGFINAKEKNGGFKNALEKWELKDKDYFMEYTIASRNERKKMNISYDKLDAKTRRIIDFIQLNIVLVNVSAEQFKERTIYKIFANLNKGGVPLSVQELRNGIYWCEFYDMLHEINETNKKWRKIYGKGIECEIDTEGKDVELLLKLCAFNQNIDYKGNKIISQKYKGSMNQILDRFSEKAIYFSKDKIELYREFLLKFFDDIENKNINIEIIDKIMDGLLPL